MNPIGMVFQRRRRSSNNSSRAMGHKDGPVAMSNLRRTLHVRQIVHHSRRTPLRLRRTMAHSHMVDTAMFLADLIPPDFSNRMEIQMAIQVDHHHPDNKQQEQLEEPPHLEPALWASACPLECN